MATINKKKGLRTTPYMTSDELGQWMKLGFLAGELEATANETKDKGWHKKLTTASTLCEQVINDRLKRLDPRQIVSVARRKDHTDLVLITSDQKRAPKSVKDDDELVTIAWEDLCDLTDLALNSCAACPQGDCVKDCFYKKVMLRLGLPTCREDVKDGECPFHWLPVGETQQIVPRNQRISNYCEEDDA